MQQPTTKERNWTLISPMFNQESPPSFDNLDGENIGFELAVNAARLVQSVLRYYFAFNDNDRGKQ